MRGLMSWLVILLVAATGCSTTRKSITKNDEPETQVEPTSVVDLKIEKYQRLVSDYPNEPKHRERLAAFLWQDGQHAEAIEQLEAALEIDRNNPKYCYMIGRVQQDQGNYRFAEENYLRAIELLPDGRFTGPHYDLAWLYLETDDAIKAERQFQRCLEIDPFDPLPHYYLGKIAFEEFRDRKRAIEHWERYMVMDGRRFHDEVHRYLVGLQPDLGRIRYEPVSSGDAEGETPPATKPKGEQPGDGGQ